MQIKKFEKSMIATSQLSLVLAMTIWSILTTSVPVIFAEEVVVTEVNLEKVRNDVFAEIVLNDQIKIKEIKVTKEKDKISVQFPEYISIQGWAYPQVEVLSKELKDRIVKAIETNKADETKLNKVRYEVVRFSPLSGNSARKANVDVMFNDMVVVTCGVIEGNNWKKIAWPSRKHNKVYIDQVLVRSKLRRQIEKDIWTKYEDYKKDGGWEGDEW